MDKNVEQQLKDLIVGWNEYELMYHPKSKLDPQREIAETSFEGITEHQSKRERLLTVRHGKVSEVQIVKRQETKFDYGDFRHEVVPGDPIEKHLSGDEEAVVIVRSEFSTKPKGPHSSTKIIEVYEGA